MEEKLESQNKKIAEHTSNTQVMQDQVNALENEKLLRLDEIELLKKKLESRNKKVAEHTSNTQVMQDQVNALETEKLLRLDEIELLKKKLESENKEMAEYTSNIPLMQDQVNALESEKLLLLDGIELPKETTLNRDSARDVQVKNEAGETSCDFLEGQEPEEIVLKDEALDVPELDVSDKPDENDESRTETGNQQPDPQMAEKIITIEAENSALKEKLTQSVTEIQSLKEDLVAAKVKLQDISDQICNLQINSDKPNIENDEPVPPMEVVETAEMGCQVDIQSEEPQATNAEPDLQNRSCQTIECIGEEAMIQTSIIGETDDHDIILDELARRIVKYDDVKSQRNEKCLVRRQLVGIACLRTFVL